MTGILLLMHSFIKEPLLGVKSKKKLMSVESGARNEPTFKIAKAFVCHTRAFNCAHINKLLIILRTSLQALLATKARLCLVTLHSCSITPAD